MRSDESLDEGRIGFFMILPYLCPALVLHGERRSRLYRLNIVDGLTLCNLKRRDLT